jgi:hypothetical protein
MSAGDRAQAIVLAHERLSDREVRDKHEHGWSGRNDRLANYLNL